ncbi:MAG TPA: class I SAM-dependent methyltransferase [Streptosporangiaceae bacterium]|nr:class I SAM-dependent methyltransferase [Streptosporangiaceae bacterium]
MTLEVGPGPGVSAEIIRRYANGLVVLERQLRLLPGLRSRLDGTTLIVAGDAVAMPFGSAEFTSVLSIMVLHHVWRPGDRERMLQESFRVLKPGGILAGVDATPAALRRRLVHLGDRVSPVDGPKLLTELGEAGFERAAIHNRGSKFKFSATRPETGCAMTAPATTASPPGYGRQSRSAVRDRS